MEFRILGSLEVVADGRPLPLGAPKQRMVLLELLRERGAVSRESLVASLWGNDPPKSAAGSVQVYVHGLRRVLGEERIETRGASYRLCVEQGDVDIDRFEQLVQRARTSLSQERAGDAADDLDAALGLWRGAALADLAQLEAAAAFARELEQRRIEALELRNDAMLVLGRNKLVLDGVERQIAEQPYRERLRAQQILALYREGRQTEALAAYRTASETWRDELGIDPTPTLQQLERAVLRHDPSLDAPPSRPTPTHRLPSAPTPLVGRRLEIAAVTGLFCTETRLVTLLGPGGTGKTRLALAVAEELAPEQRDGVVFVDLSAVFDPALLVPTIARALGVVDDASTTVEAVASRLAGQSLLLVLDNLEQIIEGVVAVAELLVAAPRLRVLATSRAALRLAAEHVYRVPPLPLPREEAAGDELAANEAVQLFLARARAKGQAVAADEDVAALCRRLDGLPLALELAAAHTKLLTPAEILARLEIDPGGVLEGSARDMPARHSGLAATIGWSLDLLEPSEQQAFARLGVFAGGCTVDAAEHVGVGFDSLAELVDHSLLQRRERFVMLETVRPFAVERLDAEGGEAVRRLHAEWLTELAERISSELPLGGDTQARLRELEAELANIRAALRWTLQADACDLGLRLVSALRPFWEIRGRLREGGAWVDEILTAAGSRWPALRANALSLAGTVAFRNGRTERAGTLYEEMLALFQQLGDEEGVARSLSDVGTVAAVAGDFATSAELLHQSATKFRELGEHKRLALVLANLGHVAGALGDHEQAAAVTSEALDVQRELGDEQRQAVSLNNLAGFALALGDRDEARRRLEECVELSLRIGYHEVVAHALATFVEIALLEDDAPGAARLGAAVDALLADVGVQLLGEEGDRFIQLKERARELLGDAAYDGEVSATTVEDALAEAERRARPHPQPHG